MGNVRSCVQDARCGQFDEGRPVSVIRSGSWHEVADGATLFSSLDTQAQSGKGEMQSLTKTFNVPCQSINSKADQSTVRGTTHRELWPTLCVSNYKRLYARSTVILLFLDGRTNGSQRRYNRSRSNS